MTWRSVRPQTIAGLALAVMLFIVGAVVFANIGQQGDKAEAGSAVWSAPANVSQNPNAQSQQPRLGASSDGEVNVVWHEDQSEILIASKSTAGSFEPPVNISCNTAGPSWSPDISIDGRNDLHTVWTDQTTGDGDPYYQFRPEGGSRTCPPTNVHETSLFSPSERVVADQGGNVHLVWSQAMGAAADIFHCYKPVSGSWSCQNLDEGISGFPHQASPAIAVDSSGTIHMAVNETLDGSANGYRIMYRSLTSGGSWSPMTEVDFSPSGSYAPDIASESGGTVHIVWSDTRESSRQIYYSTKSGGGWSTPAAIADTSADSTQPAIAVDSSGTLHVVWDDGDIYHARNDGGGWSSPENVSESSGSAGFAAIATGPGDQVHVVWEDNRTTGENPGGTYEVLYSTSAGVGQTPGPTTVAPTVTPEVSATSTATFTLGPSLTSTQTPTQTPTQTATATLTLGPSPTPTETGLLVPTDTPTRTPTRTPTNTPTATRTPSRTPTLTPTNTRTATKTPSPTPTRTFTRTPTSTETPEPQRRVVLFIQGIGSQSLCDDGREFTDKVGWIRAYLTGGDPLGAWVRPAAGLGDGESFEFRYYGYWSDLNDNPYCMGNRTFADYRGPNTCWSLDGIGRDGNPIDNGNPGASQSEQLASYLRGILDEERNTKVDIIVHSQGAALSIYTALTKLDRVTEVNKVNSIVTLDGVVSGIHDPAGLGIAAEILSGLHSCPRIPISFFPDPLNPNYDSPWDMLPSSAVIKCNTLDSCSLPSGLALYTVDAELGAKAFLGRLTTVRWARSHIVVGSSTHGRIWEGLTDGWDFRSAAVEGIRLRQFIGCAVARGLNCEDFANGYSQLVQQQSSSVLIDAVPPASQSIAVVSQWSGSTVTMSLVSPSGRLIDASTTSSDVAHDSGRTFESFEISDPEPGFWTIELFGTEVPSGGEEVFVSLVPIPEMNADSDGDQVWDFEDNCPGIQNGSQMDTDDDGVGNGCDTDNDNDGVPNSQDNCEFSPNLDQEDTNTNGIGDVCDPALSDSDQDGVLDVVDNCPSQVNPEQSDLDYDGLGNVCDESPGLSGDANCDGVVDSIDATLILQQRAGLLEALLCPDAADANADGSLSAVDATLILQFSAGLLPLL